MIQHAGELGGVAGSALGNGLIGIVNSLLKLGEFLLEAIGDLTHTRGAAYEQDFGGVMALSLSTIQAGTHDVDGAGEQIGRHIVKVIDGKADLLGATRKVQNRVCAVLGRKGKLELLGFALELLVGILVKHVLVRTRFITELILEVRNNSSIPVTAAQVFIALVADDLDVLEAIVMTERNRGDIESAAAQVVDDNVLVFIALVATIVDGGSNRLLHRAVHVKAGNLCRSERSLRLGITKISRNGDDATIVAHGHVLRSIEGELLEHISRNLLGGVGLAVNGDGNGVVADDALNKGRRVIRVNQSIVLGRLTHIVLGGVIRIKVHHRGRGVGALGVLDHHRVTRLVDVREARVGGTQVDADYRCLLVTHDYFLPLMVTRLNETIRLLAYSSSLSNCCSGST